jgi:hypothetical protein
MGYLVPCAYGNDVVTPLALTAVAPVVPQVSFPLKNFLSFFLMLNTYEFECSLWVVHTMPKIVLS